MQKILGALRRAVTDYKMIEDGDTIAVGISGGKDSLTLYTALSNYRRFADVKFRLFGVYVDMGFENADSEALSSMKAYVDSLGEELTVIKSDIAKIVFDIRKEQNPCSLCSKLRRGALDDAAKERGANKVALGHHADDVLETFLLSMIYESRLSTFMPVSYLDRSNLTLIRPLIYVSEEDISGVANKLKIPVLHNPCPADKHTSRQYMKELVRDITADIPMAKERMYTAIKSTDRYNLWPSAASGKKHG